MIDLMFTLSAAAERTPMLTGRAFNDSQDCLTFLMRQMDGLRQLRIEPPVERRAPAPWRSL